MAYLDDCTEKGFITRELVLLFIRLLLFNATFEVLVTRPLHPRNIISAPAKEITNLSTHSVNSHAQIHERVHGFDLGPR
jgi:hypothetical protein